MDSSARVRSAPTIQTTCGFFQFQNMDSDFLLCGITRAIFGGRVEWGERFYVSLRPGMLDGVGHRLLEWQICGERMKQKVFYIRQ